VARTTNVETDDPVAAADLDEPGLGAAGAVPEAIGAAKMETALRTALRVS
jgi:hypothetical protein